MEFHIIENFYFDISDDQQLRVAGPGNHLFIGFRVLNQAPIEIKDYRVENNQLILTLSFNSNQVLLSHPLVSDIRTLRNFTEGSQRQTNYAKLSAAQIAELMPKTILTRNFDHVQVISFSREFQNEQSIPQQYGAILEFDHSIHYELENQQLSFTGSGQVELIIRTISNLEISETLLAPVFNQDASLPSFEDLPDFVQKIYHETGLHIAHLIRSQKTSSFEFGTVFPRDWIESAQLGAKDLSQDVIDYMYAQSMKHVGEEGQGWHEDFVGEYRHLQAKTSPIDRKMIDIEPLYILGIDQMSKKFLLNNKNAWRLKAIGRYILRQAQNYHLITFKKKSGSDEYYEVGNWRDSLAAFPNQETPIAPYDVNCVFYPQALKILGNYREFFSVSQLDKLDQLIEEWEEKKQMFQVHFAEGLTGYCLALHGRPERPMSVAHLDESYDLFYGQPSMEDTLSFADRMLAEDYFYTPVGPILVAASTPGLTQKHYHGKVVWPKQAAFAVAGLARQYRYGRQSGWPATVLQHVYDAIIRTAESCFRGWEDLQAVTELYYFDRQQHRARFYLDQDDVEGQMSFIQLWSAVGCRRIIREYLSIKYIDQLPYDTQTDIAESSFGS